MKVDVDNQGWQMVEGSIRPRAEGANALEVGASVVPASSQAPGSAKPSSGVYVKVEGKSAADELAVMDTIPAPPSEAPAASLPQPAPVPTDLLASVTIEEHDTED